MSSVSPGTVSQRLRDADDATPCCARNPARDTIFLGRTEGAASATKRAEEKEAFCWLSGWSMFQKRTREFRITVREELGLSSSAARVER